MAAQAGRADRVVAVIDGPADLTHPDLADATLLPDHPDAPGGCADPGAVCAHGTFVTGILAAARTSPAPGICPGATLLLRPVFHDAPAGGPAARARPVDLAAALVEVVDRGATIVNLSLGLNVTSMTGQGRDLDDAFDYAFHHQVLIVAAAGNHGLVGPTPLLNHPWLIPVAACDARGSPLPRSNLGLAVGRVGLRAPGQDVTAPAPGGGYQRMTGTSVATPFVTGTAALLWSAFPGATASEIRAALQQPGTPRHSVVPPLLDAVASYQALRR